MMTSDAVDDLWHELLKDKKKYEKMCRYILGVHLEHVPEYKSRVDPSRGPGKLDIRNLNEECIDTTRMIRAEYSTLAVPLLMLDHDIENKLGFDYDVNELSYVLSSYISSPTSTSGSSCSSSGSGCSSACGGSCGSSCGSSCGD